MKSGPMPIALFQFIRTRGMVTCTIASRLDDVEEALVLDALKQVRKLPIAFWMKLEMFGKLVTYLISPLLANYAHHFLR
jgi:hypothetical protein